MKQELTAKVATRSKALSRITRNLRIVFVILLVIGIASSIPATRTSEAANPFAGSQPAGLVSLMGAPPVTVQAFSVTGGTPSPSDNDYTRINNAVQAALTGTTITLVGTFNWTEPNAAASWALGSDGVVSAVDDYSILVPAGRTNLTFTATSLGAATIEGPGDLSTVNLEAVFIFDSTDNSAFTMSNLRIRNFDLALGMFAADLDAFNGTIIQNNYILLPADLNATVAPADVNQNIGIHFSFGINQTISGNTIEFEGNGASDSANAMFASSVGMQSNTSGGAVYDGLLIDNNTLRVLNAQSADPEIILGIWENGHAHTSDIVVSNNDFINAAAGNNPALNLQRAYRVTSHSSATTTVTYSNNTANGANIGFQWLVGQNFAGNQPVVLTGNTVTNGGQGILIQSNGVATIKSNTITGNTTGVAILDTTPAVSLSFNRIVGNGTGVANSGTGVVNAENNWWGCNAGPGGTGCDTVTGNVDFDPWLVLTISALPPTVSPGGMSTVTARLTQNSAGADTSGLGHVPDGILVTFASSPEGSVSPPTATTVSGVASTTFTAGPLPGTATVSATVDNQTVMTTITIIGGGTNIVCIQDDSNGNFIVFNATTGDYTFTRCSTGFMLSGTGTVTNIGCSSRLTHNTSNRRVTATIDRCQKRGSASIQTFGPSATFTIIDRNTTNNTCACAF